MGFFVVGVTGDPYEGPSELWIFLSREAAVKRILELVGKVSLPGRDARGEPSPQHDQHYEADDLWIDGPYAEGDDLTEARNRISAWDI